MLIKNSFGQRQLFLSHWYYKHKLKKKGVRLVFTDQPMINDSPSSILIESILEGLDEYYSANLAVETMKGLRENAYQCKHTEGVPPLGYDVLPNKAYGINEREAEWVRTAMYAEGDSYRTIIEKLNSIGATTKIGKKFKNTSLFLYLTTSNIPDHMYSINQPVRTLMGKEIVISTKMKVNKSALKTECTR